MEFINRATHREVNKSIETDTEVNSTRDNYCIQVHRRRNQGGHDPQILLVMTLPPPPNYVS